MLSDVGISQYYWAKVIKIACYVMNRSSMSSLVEKTPYEAWDGKRPSLANIRVFGCHIFVHMEK